MEDSMTPLVSISPVLPDLKVQPLAGLAAMGADFTQAKLRLRQHEDALQAEYARRFAEQAKELRQQQGKDTGTVRLDADGYVVIADLPKKVEYDQERLRQAIGFLLNWGEDPDDYVVTEYKVPEGRFAAWPPKIRELFEPARTVRTGRAAFKLEAVAAESPAVFCEEA
jgi:hypothetical protein